MSGKVINIESFGAFYAVLKSLRCALKIEDTEHYIGG